MAARETITDYWRLIRPGILGMVLFSMAVAAKTACLVPASWRDLTHALVGTALVIAGAVALNQRLEYQGDAKMARTADRPLPSGRLTGRAVTRFGLLASLAGFVYLAALASPTLLGLAAVSWVIYVWTYTPLKRQSVWQTPIGALAGAMPMLLGAFAAGEPDVPMAMVLFGVVFFWQFPHSMAIAWLYRQQFSDAGVKLVTVVDPSGRTAGLIAVAGSVLLMPVSLIPAIFEWTGWPYNLTALLLGHAYMAVSFGFLRRRTDLSARWLLRVSLVYLPVLLLVLLIWGAGQ